MDLTRRPTSGVSSAVPKPAAALHSRTTPSSHHVIDLSHEATVQTQAHHAPAAAPKATVHEQHVARFTDRFDRAKRFGRSEQISRFGQADTEPFDRFGNKTLDTLVHGGVSTPVASEAPIHEHHTPLAPESEMPHMPNHVVAQHKSMANLAPAAQVAAISSGGSSRALTAFAAFALMVSYIWLQNYPKLALQSANNKAGLAASLPGYIPSSYNLAHTDTSPGLITLNFSSPSAPEVLTIAQHRTTWDSSSLLDNFVAKHADDYATFQGQGLTIYLYGPNKATWVNHGIWYSIEGAARLSREQILKIAYSL